ncbi:MAG: peptidase T [Ruthenibacterium sp.]
MRAFERFVQYAKIDTTSSETTGVTPSTEHQLVLANLLVSELAGIGVEARVDAHGYVYGGLCATQGRENAPTLGLIAHMDTAPSFSGENIVPVLHPNYDGKDIVYEKEERILKVSEFPFLRGLAGKTLITADGSTLLGADDKAGIAEIVTAFEEILAEGTPHGPLRIAFTPDEEIGEGADHFDVDGFGADFAYTLDGGAVGGIEYENFNAASAVFSITGVAVHPGSAKGIMENAALIASEIVESLPKTETPAVTERYEGFYHVESIAADGANATVHCIVRDHDAEKFAVRKTFLDTVAKNVQAAHPTAKIAVEIKDSYYNMTQQIAPCMHLIDSATTATQQAGAPVAIEPIRGGTDGARLSYMGLPCPNLGTGGYNYHGPYECITIEDMDTAVKILKNIIALYAQ